MSNKGKSHLTLTGDGGMKFTLFNFCLHICFQLKMSLLFHLSFLYYRAQSYVNSLNVHVL
jgi:hypothetical protein